MSRESSQKLKYLNGILSELKMELKLSIKESDQNLDKIADIRKQILQQEQQIDSLTRNSPVVSEHALLRYIQRLYGCDLDEIKDAILSDDLRMKIKALGGCGKYGIGNGLTAIVENNTIVTITGGDK